MEVTDLMMRRRTPTGEVTRWALVVVVSLVVPHAAYAQGFEGGVTVGVSTTDNVFLQTAPNTERDVILRATPFVRFNHESPKLDATLDYSFDWYRYTDLSTESSFHTYNAAITGKLLEEALSLQLGGSRAQVIRDPDAGIPAGRLPLSGNLADRQELFVQPRFKKTIGSTVTVDMSYRITDYNYDIANVQDNENHDARLSLDNYLRGRGLSWALRYTRQETDYEISPAWEYEQMSAELGIWINESARIFGSGGKESQWDDLEDRSPRDPFWEAGFEVNTGASFNAEFAVGERSFGSSWRGDIEYTFRRGSSRLSYSETPTTIGFGRERLPSIAIDPDNPDDFLTTPGRSESFIQNRLQWNLDLAFRRTSVGFSVFNEDREGRIDINGDRLQDQDQRGVSALVSLEVGRRTELVASGTLVNRSFASGADSEFVQFGLTANYQLGSNTQVSLGYSYADEQPSGAATSRDYVSNVFSLLFTYAFEQP